jgi:hypothetical protein
VDSSRSNLTKRNFQVQKKFSDHDSKPTPRKSPNSITSGNPKYVKNNQVQRVYNSKSKPPRGGLIGFSFVKWAKDLSIWRKYRWVKHEDKKYTKETIEEISLKL